MTKRFIVGACMAVVLLVGVTLFVAAVQPFAASAAGQGQAGSSAGEPEETQAAESGQRMHINISRNLNGEEVSGSVFITVEDPETLPQEAPDALGLFVGRDGSTLTLGSGPIEVTVDVEQINGQEPVETANASYGGEEVAVLLTADTVYYEDTTEEPFIDDAMIEAGEITITRTLEAGSADGLGEDMVVRVWGSMVDGQLTAEIVVYEPLR
jgi:hypothetical protein